MELTGRTAGIIIAVVTLLTALGAYFLVSGANVSGPAPITCAERGGTEKTEVHTFMYTSDGGAIPQITVKCVIPGE